MRRPIMIWRFSQFPELDHLDPAQRARVLATVPWWTTPYMLARSAGVAFFFSLMIGLIAGSLFGRVAFKFVMPGALLLLTVGLYLFQVRVIRLSMRRAIAGVLRGQRPPFCFGCGYDLHASQGDRCPECGISVYRTIRQ